MGTTSFRTSPASPRKRRALYAALFAVLVAASGAGAATKDPKAYVLVGADLPAGFVVGTERVVDNETAVKESTKVTMADFKRWGRRSGYERNFGKLGRSGQEEVAVTSTASVYATSAGAAESQRDAVLLCKSGVSGLRGMRLARPVGSQAFMCARLMTSQGTEVQTYVIGWRRGPIKAVVVTAGLVGKISPSLVLALARKQDARLRAG
jgi:hypothetical protein